MAERIHAHNEFEAGYGADDPRSVAGALNNATAHRQESNVGQSIKGGDYLIHTTASGDLKPGRQRFISGVSPRVAAIDAQLAKQIPPGGLRKT